MSTRAFQTLFAGKTGHVPIVCASAGMITHRQSNGRAFRGILLTSLGLASLGEHQSANLLVTLGMSYFCSVCWYPAGIAKTESGKGLDEKLLDSIVVSNIDPGAAVMRLS